MIIKNIKDVDKFFEAVDGCKGRIELLTKQGDRLNLKSKLSQYVSLTGMFSDPKIEEIELLASEPEDIVKLLEYLVRG
jgi:hypothetical protein